MSDLPPARGLVLASASPRRRALLEAAGFVFEVQPVEIEERGPDHGGAPQEAVRENARRKAEAVAAVRAGGDLVLAADTVLVLEGSWIGKPASRREAGRLVHRLGGRAHQVLTAVALRGPGAVEDLVEVTRVILKPLTPGEIRAYHAAVDPLDKAGGYDINAPGPIPGGIVASIEGSYSNVMGLPMERVGPLLARFSLRGRRPG